MHVGHMYEGCRIRYQYFESQVMFFLYKPRAVLPAYNRQRKTNANEECLHGDYFHNPRNPNPNEIVWRLQYNTIQYNIL